MGAGGRRNDSWSRKLNDGGAIDENERTGKCVQMCECFGRGDEKGGG